MARTGVCSLHSKKEIAMNDRELNYCLRRAREEARKADSTDVPAAASIHRSLAMRYSARALLLGAAESEGVTIRPASVAA